MSWLDWLSGADKLLGFGALLVASATGLFAWLRRRGHDLVGDEVEPLRKAQEKSNVRLDHVEQRIAGIESDVSSLAERTSQIERAIPTLATKEDLIALRVQGAETNATVVGIGNKVDTLYRAALAANRREE